MNSKSHTFVQEMFHDYYVRDYPLDSSPSTIDKREFGFALFEDWMLRHKSFKHGEDLREFLQSSVPSDAYYSCAYYENAEVEMDKKGWLGADLIFDIDADHIPTPCNKVHDVWVCGSCGFSGKGVAHERCPICGGEKFDAKTWPCEMCLDSAKIETVKLLDMLIHDFSFSENEVHVFFSGHRGYHVHVESEAVKTLDVIARKEIVDYVCGLGVDVILHGLTERSGRTIHAFKGLGLSDTGWRGRIARGMFADILNAKEEDLREAGLKKSVIKKILDHKDLILNNWEVSGNFDVVKDVGFESWRKIAEYSAKVRSAKIDTVVTTDIHRLIRVSGTLHGKTGLKKVEFPASTVDNFDPFKRAVAFKKGVVTVFVSDAPKFRLGDEEFGPYTNQRVELPSAAAVLLICKGRAEVAENV